MKRTLVTVVILAAISVSTYFGVCSYAHHRQKHTGPCMVTYRATSQCFYFVRPNNELFIACFDNPPEFRVGIQLKDFTYTDDNEDFKHFVKAQL